MKKLRVFILAGIVGLSFGAGSSKAAQDVWQPDTKIADFRFNMPNGWTQIQTKDGPTLVPTNLPQGGIAYIAFLPPHRLTGDLRSWFDTTWAQFQQQFIVQQAGEVERGHSQYGFDYLRIDARVSSQQLSYSEFVLAIAQVGDVAETYFWINNTGYDSYRNGLEDFEHSLQFGAGKVVQKVTHPSGGLSGLYLGYKMRGLIGLQTHFEYLVFFPDGNVIRFLPEQGLDNLSFAEILRTSRDYCGRYSLRGGQLSIDWANNSTDSGSRSGSMLKIRGDDYFHLPRSDGLKLDGTYRFEAADLADRGIRFTPDGQFVENGMLSLLTYSGDNTDPGSGVYQIRNNTLWLTYSDGRKIPLSFYIFPKTDEGQRPQVIHVNTYRLVRS